MWFSGPWKLIRLSLFIRFLVNLLSEHFQQFFPAAGRRTDFFVIRKKCFVVPANIIKLIFIFRHVHTAKKRYKVITQFRSCFCFHLFIEVRNYFQIIDSRIVLSKWGRGEVGVDFVMDSWGHEVGFCFGFLWREFNFKFFIELSLKFAKIATSTLIASAPPPTPLLTRPSPYPPVESTSI